MNKTIPLSKLFRKLPDCQALFSHEEAYNICALSANPTRRKASNDG